MTTRCLDDQRVDALLENATAMLEGALLDCFMNASISIPPAAAGSALRWRQNALRLAPRLRRVELPPHSMLYHVTTQQHLISQLRRFWDDLEPRVMLDLGCHAGHGIDTNMSDALLWLDAFGPGAKPGGRVVGVDVLEDFVIDHRYRFEHVAPYNRMGHVERRAYTFALAARD